MKAPTQKFLNKQKHQKNKATKEVIHQAISPIKTSRQKHLPVCPCLFPKKRHQQFDLFQLLHLSTPCRSSRSLLPSVINASRREGIPCRYVGSCHHSPLGWSSNTTVVSEEIGPIPWRSGGASVGVEGASSPKKEDDKWGTLWG